MNSSDDARMSLDECAREPIHIPGSIQPHGVLLAIDPDSGHIVQASANAVEVIGIAPAQLLGSNWREHIHIDRHPLDAAPSDERPLHLTYLPLRFSAKPSAVEWVGAWHLYETLWLLEMEPAISAGSQFDPAHLHPLLRQIETETSLVAAADRTARAVRRLFGYDRVMIYRFDRDWHGEVIAEARTDTIESYLGLHYPSTDIPAQARALYLRNRVRGIADCGYKPSVLLPICIADGGIPTDLSDISLRSVSPIHIEYLGNMGVDATLVTSIIVNDRLWGLISCHHYAPLFADHRMREAADVLTRTLAARIGAFEQLDTLWRESRLLSMRENLISHFNGSETLNTEGLRSFAPELLDVVEADGVALLDEAVSSRYGVLPSDDVLLAIRRFVNADGAHRLEHDVRGVIYSDALPAAFPELADRASEVAGILYIPLDAQSRSAILWTRVEQVRTVRWGGNPHLAKLQNYPGARLSPRQSFSAWREEVKGRSLPWEPIHLDSARSLRVLVELLDRKHYQQGFGLLHATLDKLQAPLFILTARRGDMRLPEILHINDAFREQTGLSDASAIIQRWDLGSTRFDNWLSVGGSFRVASESLPGSADELWELVVQPLPVDADIRHYICLLERSLVQAGREPSRPAS